MEINLDTFILNPDDSIADDGNGKNLTIRFVARMSLLNAKADDPKLKYENFCLFEKLKPLGNTELSFDDLKKIKDAVGEVQPTIITGQVWKYLDSIKAEAPEEAPVSPFKKKR